MEKFTEFSDKSTGVNPFVDIAAPGCGREHLLLKLVKLPLRFGFAFSRFFALFVLFSWLSAANLVASLFRLVPFLRRLTLRYFHLLGLRVILYVAGFFDVKFLSNRDQPFPQIDLTPPSLNHTNLIVSTFSSLFDPIVLSFRHSPLFAIPVSSSSNKIRLYTLSSLLLRWMIPLLPHPSPCDLPLAAIRAKRHRCPVVLFIEGSPSNGAGILFPEYKIPINELASFSSVCFVAPKYPMSRRQRYPVTWPMFSCSVYKKMFHLCSQTNVCQVLYSEPVAVGEIPSENQRFCQTELSYLTNTPPLDIGTSTGTRYLRFLSEKGSRRGKPHVQ
ncbi:hypothetical protein GEMRC1_001529 [Eukaryota sp. GEM-RC1]